MLAGRLHLPVEDEYVSFTFVIFSVPVEVSIAYNPTASPLAHALFGFSESYASKLIAPNLSCVTAEELMQ